MGPSSLFLRLSVDVLQLRQVAVHAGLGAVEPHCHILDRAQRHGLGQQVADGRALHGTGYDLAVDGIGHHLVQQLVLDAAADDVQAVDPLALDLLQAFQGQTVAKGQELL